MQKMTAALFPLLFLAVPGPTHDGGEGSWPQWRGPARDGLSTETEWVAEGKELWATEVGLGYSSVSIHDGRLYTMGHDEMGGMDVLWCLDPVTGEELWVHAFPSKIWNQYHTGGTLTTPSVDGDVVYAMNREGNLFSLDAATGEVHWQRQLVEELGVEPPTWGFSASPLVLDDSVVINVGKVLALDKQSGETRWTSKDYGHAYSTPADFDFRGRPVLAVFNGGGLAVIDREDGREHGLHEWSTQYDVNAATPIVMGERIFISSGYNHGCAMLELGDEGLKVAWENKSMRTQMSGCVLIDEHLYGFDESELTCIDLEGEERWTVRGLGNGALMGTADRLIVVDDEGRLIVAEASPEEFRELSSVELLSEGPFWTVPVLLDGRIYVRSTGGELVCRDHRPEATRDASATRE